MALTVTEYLRATMPNIGLVVNADGSYRIGVEDVNSDEILAELLAIGIDLGFMRANPVTTPTTGNDAAIATLAPGAAFKLKGVRIHFGGALAALETLTVTLNAGDGGAYDVVLFSSDLGTAGIVDVVIEFDSDAYSFEDDDEIIIALSANAGADVWGCHTIHELI